MRRAWSSLLMLPFATALAACNALPEPCAGAQSCSAGRECLAARCTIEGGLPVAASTRRVRVAPAALALAGPKPALSIPPSVVLGARWHDTRALYLRFPQTWRGGRVRSAFLLLEPQGAARTGADVVLEVGCAGRDWHPRELSVNEQPGLVAPFSRGIARAAPALPVRVDVTEIVRFWAEHPERDHGLGVRASSVTDVGVSLATGAAGGSAPRLDVYLDE